MSEGVKQDINISYLNMSIVHDFKFESHYLFESNLKGISLCKDAIYILTEQAKPMKSEYHPRVFSPFVTKDKLDDNPSALAVSPNGLHLIIGYQKGKYVIYDTKLGMRIINNKVNSDKVIKSIVFSEDSSSFFLITEDTYYQLELRPSLSSTQAVLLSETKNISVSDIYCTNKLRSFFILVENSRCTLFTETKKITLLDPYGQASQNSFRLRAINNFEVVTFIIYSKTTIWLYEFSLNGDNMLGKNYQNQARYNRDFDQEITDAFLFRGGIAAVVFKNHVNSSILILNKLGHPLRLIQNNEINLALNETFLRFVQNQTLYFMSTKILYRLKFISWKQLIHFHGDKRQYDEIFNIAINVYKGSNIQYFDVPISTRERCTAVQEEVLPFLEAALKESIENIYPGDDQLEIQRSVEEQISIFKTASKLDMNRFITGKATKDLYKGYDRLDFYYKYIFPEIITLAGKSIQNFESIKDFLDIANKEAIDQKIKLIEPKNVETKQRSIEPSNTFNKGSFLDMIKSGITASIIGKNIKGDEPEKKITKEEISKAKDEAESIMSQSKLVLEQNDNKVTEEKPKETVEENENKEFVEENKEKTEGLPKETEEKPKEIVEENKEIVEENENKEIVEEEQAKPKQMLNSGKQDITDDSDGYYSTDYYSESSIKLEQSTKEKPKETEEKPKEEPQKETEQKTEEEKPKEETEEKPKESEEKVEEPKEDSTKQETEVVDQPKQEEKPSEEPPKETEVVEEKPKEETEETDQPKDEEKPSEQTEEKPKEEESVKEENQEKPQETEEKPIEEEKAEETQKQEEESVEEEKHEKEPQTEEESKKEEKPKEEESVKEEEKPAENEQNVEEEEKHEESEPKEETNEIEPKNEIVQTREIKIDQENPNYSSGPEYYSSSEEESEQEKPKEEIPPNAEEQKQEETEQKQEETEQKQEEIPEKPKEEEKTEENGDIFANIEVPPKEEDEIVVPEIDIDAQVEIPEPPQPETEEKQTENEQKQIESEEEKTIELEPPPEEEEETMQKQEENKPSVFIVEDPVSKSSEQENEEQEQQKEESKEEEDYEEEEEEEEKEDPIITEAKRLLYEENGPQFPQKTLATQYEMVKNLSYDIYQYSRENHYAETLSYLWVSCYNDVIAICTYLQKANKLYEFIYKAFIENPSEFDSKNIKLIIAWLYTPLPVPGKQEKRCSRLQPLIERPDSKMCDIIMLIIGFGIVRFRDGSNLTPELIVSQTILVLSDCEYKYVSPILDNIASYTADHVRTFPLCVVQMLVRWIFSSQGNVDARQTLLRTLSANYRDIINIDSVDSILIPHCIRCGFIDIVLKVYSNNAYSGIEDVKNAKMTTEKCKKIIEAYIMSTDNRKKVFNTINEFIKSSNKQAMSEAVFSEEIFRALILIDNIQSVELLTQKENWKEIHRNIISNKCNKPDVVVYKYLSAVAKLKDKYQIFREIFSDPQIQSVYFKSVCIYEKENALSLLKEGVIMENEEEFNKGKSSYLDICIENHVVDACIHIYSLHTDIPHAIELLGKEIERELFITMEKECGKEMNIKSIDRVPSEPKLKKALANLDMAFQLLAKSPRQGAALDQIWKNLFLGFKLPMYLSQKEKYRSLSQGISLFFSYFIVQIIARSTPELALDILSNDFQFLNTDQNRLIFESVFRYLNYQNVLSNNVEDMLIVDCKSLRQGIGFMSSQANTAFEVVCAACGQPITGAGGIGMRIYKCGHCFHANPQCGLHTSCPKCCATSNDIKKEADLENDLNMNKKKGSTTRMTRGMMGKIRQLERVEYRLKRTYGKDHDERTGGNNVYFMQEYHMPKTKKIQMKVATQLKVRITDTVLEL
ncbi:hypothetical protein TVAG_101630 [Trichomonas vaginalis G3]|uniref:Uncharacterized protein n=1 Tax=Trichomonas vaginalis (strain ATCC PRA-98 / G3) TaxID=412133 RepID=A2DJP5_TRIV3|nr:VPS8 subunit of corvet complex family [Trichomonas vaginalis G3]EAY19445.1 hypothetical protein TVAG_101630 [Trichomonas vaginalis G3]KAI5493148.1 VPS8 subunit of corvet complex family [Trichomonas vaginalis G3]|eukprot:XP_001580431.1 hypothetical protein [Trichomonas vaginalis G3]